MGPRSFLSNQVQVCVQGSGDVFLPPGAPYKHLDLYVQGSGDIDSSSHNVIVESLTARVQGSGDIKGIYAARQASLTAQGSGDIRVAADSRASVSERVMGSGDIRVRRC